MDAITMYETLGPVRTNGQMTVQLTAISSKEEADKFNKLFEQQQAKAKAEGTESKPKDAPKQETAKTEQPKADKPQDEAQAAEDPQESFRRLAESGALAQLQNVVVIDQNTAAPEEMPAEEGVELLAGGMDQVGSELQPQLTAQTAPQQADVPEEEMVQEEVPQVQAAQEQPELQPQQHQVRHEQVAQHDAQEQEDTGADEVQVTDTAAAPQPVFRDVESAPIKVGEAPATEDTKPVDDLDSQMGPQLIQALEQGESRVELQLTPESLGSVKVEIVHSQDGTLHVALTAQNPQTRGLLEKHAEGLQAMLSARTQDQVRVQVQHQEESQRQDNNPYDGHNGQNHPQREQQHRQHTPESSQDFLDQLRLGLIRTDLG